MRLRGLLVSALSVLAMLASAGLPVNPVAAREVGNGYAFVDVPTYTQQRNLSCEYASLVIALGAFNTWVSEWDFDGLVPPSENPHWGYRGDINGTWGNTTDYGVYPEALVEPLAQLGFRGEVFYGQGDAGALQSFLANGVPVVVWLGLRGDQSYYEYTSDGTLFKLNPGYHVVVVYGYDGSGVYVSDPANGSSDVYLWGDFMWMWDSLDGMSLAVSPLTVDAVADDAVTGSPRVCCDEIAPRIQPVADDVEADGSVVNGIVINDRPRICC